MKVLLALVVLSFTAQLLVQAAVGETDGNLERNPDQGKGSPQSSQKVDSKGPNDPRNPDARAKNRMERQQNRVKREEKIPKAETTPGTKTQNKETPKTTKEKKSEDDGKDLKEINKAKENKDNKENDGNKDADNAKSQENHQSDHALGDFNQAAEQVELTKEQVEGLEIQNNDLNDHIAAEVQSGEVGGGIAQDVPESLEKVEEEGGAERADLQEDYQEQDKIQNDDKNDFGVNLNVEVAEESGDIEKNGIPDNSGIKIGIEEALLQGNDKNNDHQTTEEVNLDLNLNDRDQIEENNNDIEFKLEDQQIPDADFYESFTSNSDEVLSQIADNPDEPKAESLLHDSLENINPNEFNQDFEQDSGVDKEHNPINELDKEQELNSLIGEEKVIEQVVPEIELVDPVVIEVNELNENNQEADIENIEEIATDLKPEASVVANSDQLHENNPDENDRIPQNQEDLNLKENDILIDSHSQDHNSHEHHAQDFHTHEDHAQADHTHEHHEPEDSTHEHHTHEDHTQVHHDHNAEEIDLHDSHIPDLHIHDQNIIHLQIHEDHSQTEIQNLQDPNPALSNPESPSSPQPEPVPIPASPDSASPSQSLQPPGDGPDSTQTNPDSIPEANNTNHANHANPSPYTSLHSTLESIFSNFQSKYLQDPLIRFSFYLLSSLSLLYLLWPSSKSCHIQVKIQRDATFFKDLLKAVDDESEKTTKVINEKLSELNRLDQDDQVFSGIFRSLHKIQELETDFQVQVIDSHAEIWNEIEIRNTPLSPPRVIKLPIPLD